MKPKTVATLKDESSIIFRVQTTYPNSDKPDKANEFGNYAAYAFIHLDTVADLKKTGRKADNEQMAIWTHREMFRNYAVEVPGKYEGYVTSTMDFLLAEDAFRVAKFIRDECRLMSGWEHGTNWQKCYRGAIITRVVMISTRETIHEVTNA